MGYMKEYMLIIIVVILTFHLTGVLSESGTINSYIMQAVLNPQSITSSTFYLEIATIIATIAAIGIVVGILSRPPEFVYFVPLFYLFVSIGWDLIGIFLILNRINIPLAMISVSPFIILYVLSVVEWIRGM